jgi:ABC-type bacteriocin/lantibiotic exporter with double-glycine peptidase domain
MFFPASKEATAGPSVVHDILFDRVTVRLGGVDVLRNVSLPGGSVVAILGRSGSGKTTLVKALLGLLPIVTGRVVTGHGCLSNPASLARQRSETAAIFQDHALIGAGPLIHAPGRHRCKWPQPRRWTMSGCLVLLTARSPG